jgi:hypothetical protein
MVIPDARSQLHKGLDDLITGRITNVEFDAVYDQFRSSADRAVATIAEFGYGLYSDSVTYRITEHYRPSPEACEAANRCLLFLQTNLEYAWPEWPKRNPLVIWLPIGIVIGAGLLLLLNFVLGEENLFLRLSACVLMFLLVIHQFWVLFLSNRQNSRAWKNFWASGDRDAWPFLNRSDCQNALQTVTQDAGTAE